MRVSAEGRWRLTSFVELLFLREVVDAEYRTWRFFTVSPFGAGALSAKLRMRLLESSMPSTDVLYSDMPDATELMVCSSSSEDSPSVTIDDSASCALEMMVVGGLLHVHDGA